MTCLYCYKSTYHSLLCTSPLSVSLSSLCSVEISKYFLSFLAAGNVKISVEARVESVSIFSSPFSQPNFVLKQYKLLHSTTLC